MERVIEGIELQRGVDRLRAEKYGTHDLPKTETEPIFELAPGPEVPVAHTPAAEQYGLTIEEACTQLIDLRENVIRIETPNAEPTSGLLRKSMLDALLRYRPKTPDEFRSMIRLDLREQTSGAQVRKYLDQVLEIVAEIAT